MRISRAILTCLIAVAAANCQGQNSAIPGASLLPGGRAPRSTTLSTVQYGLFQYGWARSQDGHYLYYLCNNGPTTAANCIHSYAQQTTLVVLASAVRHPCSPTLVSPQAEATCGAGIAVSDKSLGSLGFTSSSEIGLILHDTASSSIENFTSGGAFDTMTVSSSTLPSGTQVQIQESISLSTSSSIPGFPQGVNCGVFPGSNGLGVGNVTFGMVSNFSGASMQASCQTGKYAIQTVNSPVTINVKVGQTYIVSNYIQADESEQDSPGKIETTIHDGRGIDSIVPVTAGVTLNFASGGTSY